MTLMQNGNMKILDFPKWSAQKFLINILKAQHVQASVKYWHIFWFQWCHPFIATMSYIIPVSVITLYMIINALKTGMVLLVKLSTILYVVFRLNLSYTGVIAS